MNVMNKLTSKKLDLPASLAQWQCVRLVSERS